MKVLYPPHIKRGAKRGGGGDFGGNKGATAEGIMKGSEEKKIGQNRKKAKRKKKGQKN